jgi:hypothetical protein
MNIKVLDKITENQERLTKIQEYVERSSELDKWDDVDIMFYGFNQNILISINHDYELLVNILKAFRKDTGMELKQDNNWFSGGSMYFKWENPLMEIRFSCNPEEVPKALMPSTSCKVVKKIIPEDVSYSIVCEVNNPV